MIRYKVLDLILSEKSDQTSSKSSIIPMLVLVALATIFLVFKDLVI